MVFPVFRGAVVAALLLASAPASAQQFSDGYEFLKAVRDADGNKVNTYLQDKSLRIVNTRDRTTGEGALHIVAKRSDALYLRVLLQQGEANRNLQDSQGNTALLIATERSWQEGVATLLRYKANVNLQNARGETPLIRAVQVHNTEIVRMLLDAGADPDKADFGSGKSARDYAREGTRWPAIAKLIADTPKGGGKPAAAGPGL
ncbi:ankyrin repeat domain-containing protein [Sphingomonas sp. M1-B02]|uniref:ankyrin repeat domain-containing protein n=1 Tax=Sphingomonas sp. M1-B02 TaxID=3114300 RepID=UPI0022400F79|nr:ankyrin repeat domain-containing protein [Sphingomonas sp. S6-11]UZK65241.1 ankyrin repeat domain-containing protein [Sphingomonas sp. S6-11]